MKSEDRSKKSDRNSLLSAKAERQAGKPWPRTTTTPWQDRPAAIPALSSTLSVPFPAFIADTPSHRFGSSLQPSSPSRRYAGSPIRRLTGSVLPSTLYACPRVAGAPCSTLLKLKSSFFEKFEADIHNLGVVFGAAIGRYFFQDLI